MIDCGAVETVSNADKKVREKVNEVIDNSRYMTVQMCEGLHGWNILASVCRFNQAGHRLVFDATVCMALSSARRQEFDDGCDRRVLSFILISGVKTGAVWPADRCSVVRGAPLRPTIVGGNMAPSEDENVCSVSSLEELERECCLRH